MTTCSRPAKAIRCANSLRKPSAISAGPSSGRGKGVEEKGIDKSTSEVLVEVDPRYFRPTEVDSLIGDPSKARAKLGWRHKTSFDALVADMVEADRVTVRDERERRNRRG